MKMLLGKLFTKYYDAGNKEIINIGYNPEDYTDYYSFVKTQHVLGYRQVILTSEIMIELVKYYFLERKFKVVSIDLMEEDSHLSSDLEYIIEKTTCDRAYFANLIKHLDFISEKSSIDIKKIELAGKENNNYIKTFFQVNGIVGVSRDEYNNELSKISPKIKRWIY
ncbi:hypothetical protein ACPWSR_13100 [Alloiococcus sp. CFN-8]|uniref:hypothetical protein n=1 Tax=Alloiococcus sp. CFN-8 TaxID=3416081 RepID=UPI003CF3DB78